MSEIQRYKSARQITSLQEELDAALKQIRKLRDVLSFYANAVDYPLAIMEVKDFNVIKDGGEKAREVLKEQP